MQLMTKQSKTSSKGSKIVPKAQNYQCTYCKKKFGKEETLITHICVKKRRFAEIHSPESRLGFRAFQRFFDLSTNSKTTKTATEFVDSQFYTEFIKFGIHIATLKPVHPDKFIDFVIKNNVKIRDWTKDSIYYTYIEHLIKTEPAIGAIERSITEISKWTDKNRAVFSDFFSLVSPNEAAHMIQTGKISPWILYLSINGGNLLSQFTTDHTRVVGTMIEPSFWLKKFKQNSEDVEYIKSVLAGTNL